MKIEDIETFIDDNAAEQAETQQKPQETDQSSTEPKEQIIEKIVEVEYNLDYKDKYLRLLAEQENLKKRLHTEKSSSIEYATKKIVKEFLDPIDNFESALGLAENTTNQDVKNYVIGFEYIKKQLSDVLEHLEVTQISTKVGDTFDPTKHDAIEKVSSDTLPENSIKSVHKSGYMFKNKVLRPAVVTVIKNTTTN